jgi:hypothetical protein
MKKVLVIAAVILLTIGLLAQFPSQQEWYRLNDQAAELYEAEQYE